MERLIHRLAILNSPQRLDLDSVDGFVFDGGFGDEDDGGALGDEVVFQEVFAGVVDGLAGVVGEV